MSRKPLTVLSAALLTASIAHAARGDKPFDLMVGDTPPALQVREWVQGEPVSGFQNDQTYVVEFWATWCGPCRKAIPHMSELQTKYGESVKFIGVSIWENLEGENSYAVPAFVKKMGADMSYTVAADRTEGTQEDVMATTWMDAAGQRGIPTAFIIDGGKVAWIGSPFDIDEPLARVHAGEWDMGAAIAAHNKVMAKEAAYSALGTKLKSLGKAERWDDALAAMDHTFRNYPEFEESFAAKRYEFLKKAGRTADAAAYGRTLVEDFYKDNASRLNALAWGIVDPKTRGSEADIGLAMLAAERANELTDWKDPAVLDTYALALFLGGKHAKAIEIQEQAVKHSAGTPFEQELEERLAEFKQEVGAKI